MKKLILLTVICCVTLITSCNEKKKFTLDPSASIILNGQLALGKAIPEPPYSLETITKHAFELSVYFDNTYEPGYGAKGLNGHDLKNNKIRVGELNEVVTKDKNGNPQLGYFTTSGMCDMVLLAARAKNDKTNEVLDRWVEVDKKPIDHFSDVRDTIGYIPNRVVDQAEAAIHTAFEAEDYDECMRLFEQAYIFIPITGAEWRALKAKNEQ